MQIPEENGLIIWSMKAKLPTVWLLSLNPNNHTAGSELWWRQDKIKHCQHCPLVSCCCQWHGIKTQQSVWSSNEGKLLCEGDRGCLICPTISQRIHYVLKGFHRTFYSIITRHYPDIKPQRVQLLAKAYFRTCKTGDSGGLLLITSP